MEQIGLKLKEVERFLGSAALVAELRGIGALRPHVRGKQQLLFDRGHVVQVWVRLGAGEFDRQLVKFRSGEAA